VILNWSVHPGQVTFESSILGPCGGACGSLA
jgi:hypothetical protein